ncbi:MAG: hypothetical protein IJK99_09090 [Bacteroidales bacterium]|nr:hypothetical protein [Bacteroidales bacterium]
MTAEELGYIRVDQKYVFHLTDGRELIKRGSWLLTTKDGHYSIDEKKCALVESCEPFGYGEKTDIREQ